MRAEAEPKGYNLLFSISLKKFFSFNLHKKRCSEASRFKVGSSVTNLMQYELSLEESDLLKAGLYFSIQPDKIRKSEIFSTFEKIHRSFLTNLKPEETKTQIKTQLSYLANSYFYNYKPAPRILHQHRVLQNLIKNKDKGNGVVILDRKLYNNPIEKTISDTSKFEKLCEDPTLKHEASLQRFLRKLKQKILFNETEYIKLYPSGSAPACIYGTPKMHKFSSGDSFPKLHLCFIYRYFSLYSCPFLL